MQGAKTPRGPANAARAGERRAGRRTPRAYVASCSANATTYTGTETRANA